MSDSVRVAVIGAGISGVVTAGHLLAAGIQVTVFERNNAAGGVWLYDKRTPIEAQYPSPRPSASQEYVKDGREDNERKILLHAPPGPCYESLTNNVSTPLLQTKLNAWPEATAPFVKHHVLKEYIQDTSKKAGVDDITKFGARVSRVHKDGPTWTVHWTTLSEDQNPIESSESANVLLLGGGVSSLDIAIEISGTAEHVYQSTRNGAFDLPESALPENASRIAEVEAFEAFELSTSTSANIEHLPLTVHLKSGKTLHDIDTIILCTGYQMALPFLDEYNDYSVSAAEASDRVLVTDGTQVHNLHQDIFYIPDPTLAFVGIPFYTATFSLFEFQAIAVTAFLSGVAKLPSSTSLRTEYENRVKEKGLGRSFHSLKDQEQPYVEELIKWVNTGRAERGLSLIGGHTETWIKERAALSERLKLILAGKLSRADILKSPLEVEVTA
ncbi:hypothetical protein PENFLA_c017G10259 [Penicillium flavigenum]|uniref:FAD/NAD(P)-binding domain-containing protein n=1 Tax=Penicillium flavigenum TaxID=254877 RepID=A0A1V6T2M8_9EURO|nr:hypothetical protein PENFLA_c017G10259 [Penicillium flavigenum]